MANYYLGKRSLTRLHKLKPRMAACVALAITFLEDVDLSVNETVRTVERQHKLYYGSPKKTWTLNSKHLIQDDGFGYAVDLVPLLHGKVAWDKCPLIAEAMFKAAAIIGIRIRWGGDWNQNGSSKDEHQRGSYDGPHFEYLGTL
ncbi:M15 family metallopeptidase [Vibrio sp. 03-59-1]|uniref:M15 family metallopeptidase n=1 Tax=Vibrio sp. 03-59-1 TaxID=2607607 RepID=UPI0014939F61|nr:M15 family metallopeptidase [Vibrio sp. 03-59-1]NOH85521.1 M15 family metallopeptidase [Vibrio sp. 03-59-1]